MTEENDEFYKQLQELLEDSPSIKDDPYFDSDSNLFGTYSKTSALKDISKITLTLSANNQPAYLDGSITVSMETKNARPVSERRFTLFIYTDTYFPMCNSESNGHFARKEARLYEYEMNSGSIWLPGSYILMVKDNKENTMTQMAFSIDPLLQVTLGDSADCEPGSLEDILTSCMENVEESWDVLATTPGASELRRHALEGRQLKVYNEFRKALNGKELFVNQNLLIYTNNSDWDEDALQAFQKLSVWGCYFTYLDCGSLFNAALQNPYEALNDKFDNTSAQVYCLTNVSVLLNTGGKVVVKRIVDKMSDKSGKYRLWFVGTRQEIDALLDVHPKLRALFLRDSHVEQQPYTAFELVQAFYKELLKANLDPTDEVKDTMARAVMESYRQGNFSTWSLDHIHRFVTENVLPRYLHRAVKEVATLEGKLPRLTLEDVDFSLLPHSKSAFEDSIEALQKMVGLDDIKQSIITMANQARFFMERKKAGLRTSNNAAYHSIFTGNPGTGKTTVAKMLGRIYHAIGLLSKGDVICVDRTRLVGRYIGETEENMKAVLEEARGNVLFIDEAYNLSEGTEDRKDFGYKVIDSLLTVLAQPNPDMVIIFAGYEKEMNEMLSTNPGLMGRFPYKYRFSDYTADQLMKIALHLFERDEYILTEEASEKLREAISQTLCQKTKNFGNARWVEQFVKNGIISAMADRMTRSTSKDYQHVIAADIEEGYRHFNPRMITLTPYRKVGFCM